jgi:hypothetical protein
MSTRCDICKRDIGRDEQVFYECPDGLPGHDWLECADCHDRSLSAASSVSHQPAKEDK